MDRVGSRLDHETSITQTAYRKERSTTEHIFAAKMAIERPTNARNETLHLVLLDMSKAFDSIKRKDLIEHLQHTIAADELHIMKKMVEVSLVVRCKDSISEPFHTDTGAPQGDCASTNSFTYYLTKSLEVQTPDAIIINLSLVMKYQVSSPSIIMHNQRKSNISMLKWNMPMILASLSVTTTTFADTNIMWKKTLVKKD